MLDGFYFTVEPEDLNNFVNPPKNYFADFLCKSQKIAKSTKVESLKIFPATCVLCQYLLIIIALNLYRRER